MAVTAAQVLMYTPEPEKRRAVFRDMFGWRNTDAACSTSRGMRAR